MGDKNPIRTFRDYFKPSNKGYRNTIELAEGKNVVPLRSDTIRLVQNGCSFYGVQSEDLNQHLKDFLKLMDSLDLDVANRKRTCLRLFQFSFRDQSRNWLERLPEGSISTWEDLTTLLSAQFLTATNDSQCSYKQLTFNQCITLCQKADQNKSRDDKSEDEGREEEGNPENINTTPPSPLDPLITFITEKVRKLNSFLESSDLVPRSSDEKFVCTKDDGYVMFVEIIKKNEEDKRRGVEYVMSKILGFYKECLELGPEYLTGVADEGEINVLKTNTPYPSRRYGVSVPALTKRPQKFKDQYAVSRGLNTLMDDPNITMEEYIKLEEEKARRRGRVFNWQTTTYGKIRVDDDLHRLSSMEAEFPAIVINYAFAPQDAL
ncbi:zinc finger, CCHC-type containing protein [Tanacetum coccineum]